MTGGQSGGRWRRAVLVPALLAAALSASAGLPAAAAPEVVVSIKPLHSLAASVMQGVAEPRLLVSGGASPHLYQMRPSEARMLRRADLVVWIGPGLESFLTRPVATLGAGAIVLTLHEEPGLRLLPNREGGIFEHGAQSEVHADEHADHGHDHGEFDMHLWLDPGNARRIAGVISDALVRIDPANAGTYRRNAEAVQARIHALAAALRAHLAPLGDRAFIVFHDGYRYFEEAFGLEAAGAVAVDPARPPGARRLAELRATLAARNVSCVFTEPQFEPDLVRTVVEGTGVRTASLDPIGLAALSGPDAWFEIMRDLGAAFERCLSGGRS